MKKEDLNHPSTLQWEKNENEFENENCGKLKLQEKKVVQLCLKHPLCFGTNEAGSFALGQRKLAMGQRKLPGFLSDI